MKTLESIREEIWEEMLRLEDKRKDQWADVKYQTLREVLQKLGHLDEPEVLSQEWIDENEEQEEMYGSYGVPVHKLQNLLVPKQKITEELHETIMRAFDVETTSKTIEKLTGMTLEEIKEEARNGGIVPTLPETKTVADVIADFFKSYERLKEVMNMEVEELE